MYCYNFAVQRYIIYLYINAFCVFYLTVLTIVSVFLALLTHDCVFHGAHSRGKSL